MIVSLIHKPISMVPDQCREGRGMGCGDDEKEIDRMRKSPFHKSNAVRRSEEVRITWPRR